MYNIYLISMVRNDADIILPFLSAAETIFDKVIIADVQSTDGTRQALDAFAKASGKFTIHTVDRPEKYQSALMNRLARQAFADGADWVFFLDSDEFLNVENRQTLDDCLRSFNDIVMHLPWMNLVPTEYGDFNHFNADQTFYWSGRFSKFNKVALSSLFASNHPDFFINEGNHTVCVDNLSEPRPSASGLAILHVPVRSMERLKFKMGAALSLLMSKHNRLPGEGVHVERIDEAIQQGAFDVKHLDAVAAFYGAFEDNNIWDAALDPAGDGWPRVTLPRLQSVVSTPPEPVGMTETARRAAELAWSKAQFVPGSPVRAEIVDGGLQIQPQPVRGSGKFRQGRFEALSDINPNAPQTIDARLVTDAAIAAFQDIKVQTYSAWSELIPLLFCLFTLLKPRRFVELGTHNGMSFFAACQAQSAASVCTECVAVDNWIGDPHASFHSTEVFDRFSRTLDKTFPEQTYIRANFQEALSCFEDGSIDLLHIDGFHTYEAVRNDFDTWLPKMSATGVIIFHDINVHERNFGVWRFWEEEKVHYPSFSVLHCHGLGILCVGSQPTALRSFLTWLNGDPGRKEVARTVMGLLGRQSVALLNAQAKLQALDRSGASQFGVVVQEADLANDRASLEAVEFFRRDAGRVRLRRFNLGLAGRLPFLRKLLMRQLNKRDAQIIAESNLFDREFYLSTNPDLAKTRLDPCLHYVAHGVYEMRNPNAEFDTAGYLRRNRDIALSGLNPFAHYIQFGQKEGRTW